MSPILVLPFSMFLAIIEKKYCGEGSVDEIALSEAIDELYQTYVEDVVKKVTDLYVIIIFSSPSSKKTHINEVLDVKFNSIQCKILYLIFFRQVQIKNRLQNI